MFQKKYFVLSLIAVLCFIPSKVLSIDFSKVPMAGLLGEEVPLIIIANCNSDICINLKKEIPVQEKTLENYNNELIELIKKETDPKVVKLFKKIEKIDTQLKKPGGWRKNVNFKTLRDLVDKLFDIMESKDPVFAQTKNKFYDQLAHVNTLKRDLGTEALKQYSEKTEENNF